MGILHGAMGILHGAMGIRESIPMLSYPHSSNHQKAWQKKGL